MAGIDQEVRSRFANNKQRFMANLVFTSNWIQNIVNDFLKPFGISFQQFNILRILKGGNDWMTMNDIKSRMVEKAPNATRLSDKLLNKGLVERKRSEEDRRVVYLHISKKGLELLTKIDEKNPVEIDNFFSRLNDKKAKELSDLLDHLRE